MATTWAATTTMWADDQASWLGIVAVNATSAPTVANLTTATPTVANATRSTATVAAAATSTPGVTD